MMNLKIADKVMDFKGFSLQPGFLYGEDNGVPVATSGFEVNDDILFYYLQGQSWAKRWIDQKDCCFNIDNLPQIDFSKKKSFADWLEEDQEISTQEWDENYSGAAAQQILEKYDSYYYDDLPKFVQKCYGK